MLKKQRFYKIEEIIDYFKMDFSFGDMADLYAKDTGQICLNTEYWLDEPLDADDEDNEVYPSEVISHQLHFIYSGQQFADVIDTVIEQKPNANMKDFVDALNYYAEHDTFMEF